MAQRIVLISDLTGKEVPDGDQVIINVLEYPQLSEPVQLDASSVEADRLKLEGKPMALIEIVTGNNSERVAIDADQFAKAVKGDVYEVLSGAARIVVAQPASPSQDVPRQRRARGTGSAARGDKIDYSDPANAGRPKRGITSDAEKQTVRDHFDEVNQNLEAAGIRTLDLSDIATVEKYGLQELAKERKVEPIAK